MTKTLSASVVSGALIAAVAALVPVSALALTLNSSNITITNSNSGGIISSTNSKSSTGGNYAGGSTGGNGGKGGSVSSGTTSSCTNTTTTVVSDATATFSGDDGTGNAVVLTYNHPAWASISGANWIWAQQGPSNPNVNQTDTFTDLFNWNGSSVASVDLYVLGDNYYTVYVNGNNITGTGGTATDNNFSAVAHYTVPAGDITSGSNTLTVVGENEGVPGSNTTSNPAGVDYKLVVAGQTCSQNTGGGTGGAGGAGGNSGSGGVVTTGNATSHSGSVNVLNVNKIFIH